MRQYLYDEALCMAGDPETYDKIQAIQNLIKAVVNPINRSDMRSLCIVYYAIEAGQLFEVCIMGPGAVLDRYSVAEDSMLACIRDTLTAISKMIAVWE